MLLEIDLPNSCNDCAFCEECIYCGLLNGEPIYNGFPDGTWDKRPDFCPFDNEEKRAEMHDGVKFV